MRLPLIFAAMVPLVAAAAASRDEQVSFARDVQPIFNAQCVMCHNSDDPHAGLVLDAGLSHSQLVGMGSSETSQMLRVAAGKPDQSYIVRKLENTHLEAGGKGWWMPPPTHIASSITLQDRTLIRTWIIQGAKDN